MSSHLERAIAYLAAAQRPSGELPTFSSRHASMAEARPYPCSVYVSAFVALALARIAGQPLADTVRERACAHLRAERNPGGSWGYEGRATRRVPPDLDDTALVQAALLSCGDAADFAFFRLLWENESRPGGPYYTWVGVNGQDHLLARQVDALVNANLLYAATRCGQPLPGTAAYLAEVIAQASYDEASVYCFTPHLLAFCIARAAGAGAAGLADALPALRAYVANTILPSAGSPFQLACGTAALAYLGAPAAVLAPQRAALCASQLADGSWPIAAAYSGYPPHFDGSPALSTALAIEALLE
jgi:hypothetical protein